MAARPGPRGSIYSVSPPKTEPRPRAASYLVIAGSLLVLVEALLLVEIGLLIVGLFLFIVGLLIFAEPHHHLANGILGILLALLSLLFGFGGFYLGAVLAGVGGALSIVWSPPKSPVLAMGRRSSTSSSVSPTR